MTDINQLEAEINDLKDEMEKLRLLLKSLYEIVLSGKKVRVS